MKKPKRKHPKGVSNARWICAVCNEPFNDYWSFEEHAKMHAKDKEKSGGEDTPRETS